MTFSEALLILKAGTEIKLRRKAWYNIYYCYIDNRFPDKFQFCYDKEFFTAEDLLKEDWEVFNK